MFSSEMVKLFVRGKELIVFTMESDYMYISGENREFAYQ